MNKLLFVFVIFVVIFNDNCESKQISRTIANFKKGIKEAIVTAIQRCNAGEKLPEFLKLIVEGRYTEDDDFKKFIHCGYKESGYSHENGRVDLEKASQAFDGNNDVILKVMQECDKELDDPVQNTFEFFKCFQDNSPYLIQLTK